MAVTSIADLLTLLTREPGRPRVTWYGDGGERVELSGAVLVNWVNKTTNLLVEEFDAAPGTRVLLDLPGHWRTTLWAMAAWRAGACVVLGDGHDADVVVTDRPEDRTDLRPDVHPGADVVAVALPALARTFGPTLPRGALDAAGAVMTYGDTIGWTAAPDPAAPAWVAGTSLVPHADLLDGTPAQPGGERVLVRVEPGTVDRGAARVLRLALDTWQADGSVVLLSATLATDVARLAATERVTRTA